MKSCASAWLLLLLLAAAAVSAPKDPAKSPGGRSTDVAPEREAAVRAFVEQHHPELADLLVRLKQHDKREYAKAIRDLFRTSDRLVQIRDRDKGRYRLEVRLWKSKSRIQVLAARVQMSDSPELREQLRQALAEQVDAQIAIWEREKQRALDRAQRIDMQIERLRKNDKAAIERQLRLLTDQPENSPAGGGKQKTAPAAKNPTPQSGV